MKRSLHLFGANKHLSELARRYLWTAGVVAALAISTGLLEGVGVGLLIPLLSTFTNDLDTRRGGALGFIQRFAQGHTRDQRLVIVCSVILGCMLLKSALQIVANRFASWVDGGVGQTIRCSLAERLLNVGYSFYLVEDSARLLNIISSESWRASDAIRVVLSRIAEAAGILVFSILLLLVSWKLMLLVLVGGALARLLQRRVEVKLRLLSGHTVTANQNLADRMLFVVFAGRLIRLFNTQDHEKELFERSSEKLCRTNLDVENLSGTLGPLLEALHGVLFIAVLLVAVFTGVNLPVLAAFLVLMNRLQPHLRAFEQAGASFASSIAHLAEVEWLLDPTGKPTTHKGHLPFDQLRDGIVFENVTFEYHDRAEPALNHASFTLRKGRSTALIGSSGAGKSTIISLLCRLVEPVSGAIRVDGQALSDLRLADWLGSIAVAGQDIDLIDASIADNIGYGLPALEPAKILRAAKAAGADFVDELPHGLETVVGAQGLALSGGQRQRIGIARALVREPKILIFDEATNAVDHETEDNIILTLRNLPASTTLIVISHRRSSIAFCDDAVLIDRGRVLKTGTLEAVLQGDWPHIGGLGVATPLQAH